MRNKVIAEKVVMGFHYICGCSNTQVFTNSDNLEESGFPICSQCDRPLEANYFWEIEDDGVIVEPEMTLEDWQPYPFHSGRLHGKIFNDRKLRFKDGEEIFTSQVQEVKDGIAYTKFGSAYKLGTPHKSVFGITED